METPDDKLTEIVSGIAEKGWSVQKNFLSSEFIRKIYDEAENLWSDGKFRKAGVGYGADLKVIPEVRSDCVLWINPDDLTLVQKEYWNTIDKLRLYLNSGLFLGLKNFEAHFALYLPGTFYKKHLDSFAKVKYRTISCVLYLNHGWEEKFGSQLRIYESDEEGKEKFTDIIPEGGTFVCFRSDTIYHEVLPGEKERFSLTGWLKKEQVM